MPIDKDRFHNLLAELTERHPGIRNIERPVTEVRYYYELLQDAGFIVCDFVSSQPRVRVMAAGYAVARAAADRGENAFDLYVEHLFGQDNALIQSIDSLLVSIDRSLDKGS